MIVLTASERKLLGTDNWESESDVYEQGPCELVHLSDTKRAFEQSHNCPDALMILVEDEEQRYWQSARKGSWIFIAT